MTTRKRRTGTSRTGTARSGTARSGTGRTGTSRSGAGRGRSDYRSRRTRRRVSPASTLGTAAGVAVSVALIGLLGGLPWWGWLLLVVAAGVAVLGIWVVRRSGDAEPDPGPEPAPPADGRGATGT